ncbi:MAG: hypothetical protein RIS70_2390 [Planctomycetota bacterium]
MSDVVRRNRGRKLLLFFALLAVGLIGFAITWPYLQSPPPDEHDDHIESPRQIQAYTKPKAIDNRFAGSESCRSCHAEIFAAYEATPKAKSIVAVNASSLDESMDHALFEPAGPRKYSAEIKDGKLLHHEFLRDDESTIYDQSEEVAYRLGAGERMRAYLINHDGLLFQSPIAYYPETQDWKLAEGYRPESHDRFSRRVGDDCLYCHAGRVLPVERNSNRYEKEVFAEPAIGCERCHGPGEAHVKKQTESKTNTGHDATIVNPKSLPVRERESVCNSCHLHGEFATPRYGHTFLDFRPGQALDDTLVTFVSNAPGDPTDPAARGPVEQMRLSRCYEQSEGTFGCNSCHDPHGRVPEDQRSAHYAKRCQQCHADKGCSLPAEQRNAEPAGGSCIHCHMPSLPNRALYHASRTDHRILRKPQPFADKPPVTNPEEWQYFDGADYRLPQREASRARGLALMSRAGRRNREFAMRAELHLVDGTPKSITLERLLAATNDDILALETLGRMYIISERPENAVKTWMFGLEKDPRNEILLQSLGTYFHERVELEQAESMFSQFVALNRFAPRLLGRYSHVLAEQDKWPQAIEMAERSVQLDPTIPQLREWLAKTYELAGQPEKAKAQSEILDRIKAAGLK